MGENKKIPESDVIEKCNMCGWEGPANHEIEKFSMETGTTWHCPICSSRDIDPIDYNPYDDEPEDEDDDDDGGTNRLLPVGGGGYINGGHN